MSGRTWSSVGLFLAAVAAFSIALGQPHVALAANEGTNRSSVDKVMDTAAGKAALARVGLSEAKFEEMLSKLSADQKKELVNLVQSSTPKSRLMAKMVAAGYTPAEVQSRIALLTDDEIAKLADDPEAMTAGTQVEILIAVIITVLILWIYFGMFESTPAPAPSPAPAK